MDSISYFNKIADFLKSILFYIIGQIKFLTLQPNKSSSIKCEPCCFIIIVQKEDYTLIGSERNLKHYFLLSQIKIITFRFHMTK